MGCNKINNTCGGNKYALRCVDAEGITPPEVSPLYEQGCLSGYEVIEDIYDLLGKAVASLDTTKIDFSCVDIDTNEDGEITQREINKGLINYICKLPTTSDINNGFNLGACNLDYGALVNICNDNIETLCELLQVLVNSANALNTAEATIGVLQAQALDFEARIAALEVFHP